jgi:hypothetical protein
LYLNVHPTPKGRKIDAPIRGTDPPLGVIEYMAAAADLRAMRRVAQVGRQKYAQELVEKDRARSGGRIEHIVYGAWDWDLTKSIAAVRSPRQRHHDAEKSASDE